MFPKLNNLPKIFNAILAKYSTAELAIAIFVGALVAVTPLLVNYENIPKGYEIPKIIFVQFISIIIVIVSLGELLRSIAYEKKIPKIRLQMLLLCLVTISFIVSTTFAYDLHQAVWGTDFRMQGVIYNIALLLTWATLIFRFSGAAFNIALAGYLFSLVTQSLIALSQLYKYFPKRMDIILEGLYINGSFGQANFFAGRMILSMLISCLLILLVSRQIQLKTKRKRAALALITGILFGLAILSIVASLSKGSWLMLSASLTLFPYPWIATKFGYWPTRIAYLILTIVGLALMISLVQGDFRMHMWLAGIAFTLEHKVFWGFGFDNQYFAFREYFPNLVVDRAHNILIDAFMNTGLIGLTTMLALLWKYILQIAHQLEDNKDFATRLLMTALVYTFLRMLVHTNSGVNAIDLVIVFAMWNYYSQSVQQRKTSETM